jgi:Tfp pilus assembly protein PilV
VSNNNNTIKSFSLVEIIIAIAIFSLIAISVSIFAIDSFRFSEYNKEQKKADLVIQDTINAINQSRSDLWQNIIDNTDAGAKHFTLVSNKYAFAAGAQTVGDITTSLTIASVQRDVDGNVVASGGTNDINSRSVTMTVSWSDPLGFAQQLIDTFYINNWATPNWTTTTQADFTPGTQNHTIVTSTGNGAEEIDLSPVVHPDWCLPVITDTSYNLLRQGSPTSISSIPNFAVMGTGGNASGPALDSVNVTSDNPPVYTQGLTWGGSYKVNDIYILDNHYAYVITDDNSKEIVIVDLSVNPYAEVGSFNASGSTDGNAVWVQGNVGYMTQGSTLRTFDLNQKTGVRSQLGSITLAATGSDLQVVGNYAYVAINGASQELQIINVTNPASLSIVGQADVNGAAATSLYVSPDGNRVYIGTTNSGSQPELFIINTSIKTGNRPNVGSGDTNGTSIKALAYIDNRVVIVGTSGQEYQVFDVSNESVPVKCGGMDDNAGLYGVSLVIDAPGNKWSYVLSGNSSAELHVILGNEFGGGGGQGQGSDYYPTADYTSLIFNTTSATVKYYSISWDATMFVNTTLSFQVRAATTSGGVASATWVGPNGTSATYFTNSFGEYLPAAVQAKQYIQYKAFFTTDKVYTPVLNSVKINYQP